MAANLGPRIVKSGLLLELDAADINSYVGSGTSWKDLSGNGYNGTLTNGPTFSGTNGGNIVFNGVNQYVDVANTSALDFTNTSGTISVWCKYSTVNSGGAYMLSKTMDATGGWGVTIANTGVPYFEIKNNASGATACYRFANKAYNDGTWHNIVSVFTTSTTVVANNTINMYVDGTLSNAALNQILVYGGNTAGTIQLSRRTLGDYYNGNISNVQIYNRALTAAEVLQNYNAVKARFGV
jgi:hypothetical protein